MPRTVMAICTVASLCGCNAPASQSCVPGFGSPVEVFTLFLGKSIPGREELNDREWQVFLDTTVTANLPNGYTVLDANGGWMNPHTHQTVKENTKVVLVALPAVPDSLAAVNRVRAAYQVQYHQQLVGMTVERACGEF